MSSIIDALKKSDKNRNSESAQNINQIKFGQESSQKSRRGFWLLVTFLLLVAVSVLAWQQGWHNQVVNQATIWLGGQENSQVEPVSKKQNPANNALSTTDENNVVKSNNQGQSNRPTNKSVSDQGNKLNPPKANEVKAKSLAAEQSNVAAKPESSSESQEQLEVIAKRNSSNEQSKSDVSSQNPVNSSVTQTEVDKKTELLKPEQKLKQQNNRKDTEPRLKQDYLLVHQIDFEVRKNIPPIKLNVHIYDPEPENRMVILNGVKYATGDSIEDLVTVEAINKEGVVLAFEGTKFLIPK